jgi:hypothetical protein
MITYNDAEARYNKTKKPPRSKKYNEFQRPLRRVTESWLMLQKDNHSYVYIINDKEVGRFCEPNELGESEVLVRGLYATFDIQQMYKYTGLHSGQTFETTTGDRVQVPYNPFFKGQEKDYSALLTFDKDGKLIVAKSWHCDIYTYKSTEEDKNKRKALKEQLDAFVTLQMFKLGSLRDNATVNEGMGRAFGESELSSSTARNLQLFLAQDVIPTDDPIFMACFNDLAQSAFDMLASKKIHEHPVPPELNVNGWRSRNLFSIRNYGNDQALKDSAGKLMYEVMHSIVPDELKKSLVASLLKLAGLSKGSQPVAIPQFSVKLPRRYSYG